MMKKIVAYAWASGLIEFGQACPGGALPILIGEENSVRERVDVLARHSRTSDDIFVPGIPEAASQDEGMNALTRFVKELNKRENK
ncbi:host nuclease inhibitor protein [Salmonella enterica subsp. enterica serovar Thompson]|nr:host nuclease inhibitor protein [Salmonella enterica]EHF4167629.1 host nuclease inhibitor protein [Salmonella enterica subsp. enterica serovar Thompson]ELV5264629.1 host nuclease inhibitor protein [Salmonella enterica]